MTNPANETANPSSVRRYLLAAYRVDDATVDAALADREVQEVIANGESFRSHAYYVGNKIAEGHAWDENPEYDPDAEDDDEEDA